MNKFCLNLRDNGITSENAGNKAYVLSTITEIPIPNGFVITTEAFEKFIKNNGLYRTINNALNSFADKKISAKEAAMRIKTAISKGKIEIGILDEISNESSKLTPPFAVRSSSTAEDSLRFSFAGLFDSFLYVEPGNLEEKIKEVYASLFNERAIEYAYQNNIDLRHIKMGVLVQEMIKEGKFGVGFHFSNKGEIFIIESTVGEPHEVTSGRSIPDTYVIKGGEILKYPRKVNINSLFEFEIEEITNLMRKLKNRVFPLDIEWALEKDKLWLLQLRPLTKSVPIPEGKELLNGLPASSGKASGKAVVWTNQKKEELERGKDKILVAVEVQIEDVGLIKEYGGVVLEVSGATAHAAILARELKIPCIVGVDGITKIVKPGERVSIDGDTGRITFLDRELFSIERKYQPIYIDPRKLSCFESDKHLVLFLEEKGYAIVYHAGLKGELKEISEELGKEMNKPLVDGGVDVWYGYATVLEMSKLKSEIYQDLLQGLESVDTMDQKKILKTIEKYTEKAEDFYKEAEKEFKFYRNVKDREVLARALLYADFAFAYWRIIGYAMIYDHAGSILDKMGVAQREGFLKFLNEIEQNKHINELGDKITALIKNILNISKGNLNIDYSLYTSEAALIRAIGLDTNNGDDKKRILLKQ